MAEHHDLALGERHPDVDKEYADTTARDADTAWNGLTTNIHGTVAVGSSGSWEYYKLTSNTPTWALTSLDESGEAANIYNEDGTTTGARTVTLANNLNIKADADGSHTVEIGDSITDRVDTFNAWTDNIASLNAGATNDRSYVTLYGITIKGMELGYFENETSLMGFRINFSDDQNFEAIDQIGSKGIIYAADYSTNFTDRSLVDKGYVDGLVGNGSIYEADGSLTGNRVVTMGSNDIQFLTESANTHFEVFASNGNSSSYSQRSSISVDHNGIVLSDAQATLGVENTLQSISITPSGIVFTDLLNLRGPTLAADYSAAATNRTIMDKEYIDGAGLGRTDQTLTANRSLYLSADDLRIYAGDDTTTQLFSFEGGNDGTDLSPYITMHEHMRVGDGKHFNIGKGGYIKFNDGTASTNMFRITAEVNGSNVFQHMTTDFYGIEHVYQNIDDLTWYFDSAGNRLWSIYDNDEGSTPDLLIQLDSQNKKFIFGEQGSNVSLTWPTGVTAGDEWRLRVGNSSDRLQFFYYDDSAGTSTTQTTIDSAGNWRIEGDIFTESQTAIPLAPAFPAQVEGAATNYTVTTTYTTIVLDSVTIDQSAAEYTVNTTNNRIEFDTADGTKVYEVIWHANFLLENQANTGATRSSARIKAQLDGVDVTGSEEWCYIREYQGGVNGFADSGTSGSFIIQPALDDQLTFLVVGETESGQTLTDFELDSFTAVVKRLT